MGSKPLKLAQDDLTKLWKGLLLAVGGAAVVYLGEWVSSTDFGAFTPIVTAGAAVALNFLRKLITDTTA